MIYIIDIMSFLIPPKTINNDELKSKNPSISYQGSTLHSHSGYNLTTAANHTKMKYSCEFRCTILNHRGITGGESLKACKASSTTLP
jgi:hypothetical protein